MKYKCIVEPILLGWTSRSSRRAAVIHHLHANSGRLSVRKVEKTTRSSLHPNEILPCFKKTTTKGHFEGWCCRHSLYVWTMTAVICYPSCPMPTVVTVCSLLHLAVRLGQWVPAQLWKTTFRFCCRLTEFFQSFILLTDKLTALKEARAAVFGLIQAQITFIRLSTNRSCGHRCR